MPARRFRRYHWIGILLGLCLALLAAGSAIGPAVPAATDLPGAGAPGSGAAEPGGDGAAGSPDRPAGSGDGTTISAGGSSTADPGNSGGSDPGSSGSDPGSSGSDPGGPAYSPGGGTLPAGAPGAPVAAAAPDCPPPGSAAAPAEYDILIRGGTVVDGTGAPARQADVAVSGACIVAVGRLTPTRPPRVILDATGMVIAPGFINPHSHTWDPQSATDPDGVGSLLQGLTTEVGGVDGRSGWPIGEFLARVEEQGTGVNYMTFAGQGTIRRQVMGTANRAPTPEELAQMQALVARAMAEGAAGLSSGLEYVPGRYSDEAEVAALARTAAERGGLYSTHMRSEGDRILEALDEALAVGRDGGLPVNLSHFKVVWQRNWDQFPAVLERIAAARAAGLEVFADVYPYEAPDYAAHRPLAEGRTLARPEHLVIKQAQDAALLGRTVAQVAQERGWPPDEAARRLLDEDGSVIVAAGVVSRDHILALLAADFTVVGTDGGAKPWYRNPATALQVHPRSYGSYPRVLRWQREGLLPLSLEQAIRKMSGATADHLRLHGRGYVWPGYYADLVVLDPAAVADLAAWEAPQQYSVGVRDVLVNGVVVVSGGEPLRIRAGQVIRYPGLQG